MTCPTPTGYVSVPCANHTPFPQHLHTLAATGADVAYPFLVAALLLIIVGLIFVLVRSRKAN